MARSGTNMVCSWGQSRLSVGGLYRMEESQGQFGFPQIDYRVASPCRMILKCKKRLGTETVLHQLLDVVDDIHDIRLRGPRL